MSAFHQIPARSFAPPPWLRSGSTQTFLASTAPRRRSRALTGSREVVIQTSEGVRLLGFRSEPRGRRRGVVILLHGWEGSSHSVYLHNSAAFLLESGYGVFRLNLRDHGPSHHLNPGIFYASLVQEVHDAVTAVAKEAEGDPVFLMGFSLGGNFALRVGLEESRRSAPTLSHILAISPVLDPASATARIDANPIIRRYFLRKWRRSLAVKEEIFPGLYDFRQARAKGTILAVTETLLHQYSRYESCEEYFRGYTLTGDTLGGLAIPATLLTAADDPIIPLADFRDIALSHATHLSVQDHGGHNGFLDRNLSVPWYLHQAIEIFG